MKQLKKLGQIPWTLILVSMTVGVLIGGFISIMAFHASYTPSSSYDNSDNSDDSAPQVVPNDGYDSEDDHVSGSTLAPGTPSFAYINLQNGHITRVIDDYDDILFEDGFAPVDEKVQFPYMDGTFGGHTLVQANFAGQSGQQVTLDTHLQWSTLETDLSEQLTFYNQHIAKRIDPAAPPVEYLDPMGQLLLEYAQGVIETGVQQGTIAKPTYSAVGTPISVSDGNGSTCVQYTVVMTNAADITKQMNTLLGDPNLFSTSLSTSGGYVTVPNTQQCQSLIAQAAPWQTQGKGPGYPAPPGWGEDQGGTDQGGTDQGGTDQGSTDGSEDASGGTVSGSTTAGSDLMCPTPQTGLTFYTCQGGSDE